MPHYLLFYAFTPQQVAQCRYFPLKYLALYNLKPPAPITAVVYTSQPVAFEGFTNFFPQFLMPHFPDALPAIRKADVLHRFFLQYSGAVLYCDAATYPLQLLEPLFSDMERGTIYLHTPRRYPETDLNAALRKATTLTDKTKTAVATPAARINVWHTAVIGLTNRHKETIAAIRSEEATTELALDYAFTRHLGEDGKIKSAGKAIFAYGDFKEFDQLLDAFFKKTEEESIPNQVKLMHHIDAAAIQQQKTEYHQQPFFKKWLQTLTGKRWSIQAYTSKL